MDKRSLIEDRIELHNGNLLCVELEEATMKSGLFSGVSKKEKRYKRLQILKGDDAVEKDDIIYVPVNAGTEVEDNGNFYILANRRDILMLYKHGG